MINLIIFLSCFLLNSFTMETDRDFVTIDINDSSLIQSLKIKTDSDLITIFPAEIWQLILANLDLNDKKNLKTILRFFAPRLGLPENLAKIIAVNLSNYAALKSVNMDDWKDTINNSYKNWGKLKNYKSKLALDSQEKIREYLKIINSKFFKKIATYNSILTGNNIKEDLEGFWRIVESEFANILKIENINHNDSEIWPNIFRYAGDEDLKPIYLEIRKCLLLGKYQIISIKKNLFAALVVLLFPHMFWVLFFPDHKIPLITIPLLYTLFFCAYIISYRISKTFDPTFILSLKNILSRQKRNYVQEYPVSNNLIHVETRIQKKLGNYNDIQEYESLILEYLNEQLNEQEKNQPLIEFSDI